MPPPITAARLARETEVSLRSLYRDIESLRTAGARIEGERGYGYRLVEDYALPPQTFDRAEIEALALGLAEVQRMGDPTLERAATSVLAKVAASLPDDREQFLFHAVSRVYRPDPRNAATCDVEAVREACWKEEALHIRYTDGNGAVTERVILPLAVVYTDRTLTLLAWCCLREAFRMFLSDRITGIRATGTSFRPKRVTLLRTYLGELESSSGDRPANP
ncbi:helix-turn-helix transcriptional regulator [Pararoseomonas indoligenes]|uniref:YafY family transcriptional regulator n=1 Tax=Roseomonas indoligenes TaxID=2820811 RepID=A0A940N219_9PROT|nr:YafY family protein [Pararoseomonas indoligenes]MBP0495788.1 YafY family transcriptional regulator [Pararoseomonas indoligenes]